MIAVTLMFFCLFLVSLITAIKEIPKKKNLAEITMKGDLAETTIPSISIGVDIRGQNVEIPLIGAGTLTYNNTQAYESVCKAFQMGYTLVDTAFGNRNQKGVGRAIRDCWTKDRSELFVLTKIPGGLTRDEVWAAHEQNLIDLDLDYVDHLMINYPADVFVRPDRATPERRQEEWRALQEIYETRGARTIGISHYCSRHIDDVLRASYIVRPSINQVEYHVGSSDVNRVLRKCRRHNITFMSFSPLCGSCTYQTQDSLISGTLVKEIASKYGVTGPQVSLRFIVQQALQQDSGIGGVIPRSNNLEHIKMNRDIFRFSLSQDDMDRLFNATKPGAKVGDCDVS